jgi:hypothetical protein
MKKLIIGFFSLFTMTSFAQDSSIPNSVAELGSKYQNEYLSVAQKVHQARVAITDREIKLNTTQALYDVSNSFWSQSTGEDLGGAIVNYNQNMVSNLDQMIRTRNYSMSNILNNNLEKNTFVFLSSIVNGMSKIPEGVTLDQYLFGYSQKLKVSNLSAQNKELVSNFILGFNVAYGEMVTIFTEKYPNQIETQGKQAACCGWLKALIKCAAGTIGGALTGGIAGAAVGSSVPAIGTAAGAAVGLIGGGLTGATAAGCFD